MRQIKALFLALTLFMYAVSAAACTSTPPDYDDQYKSLTDYQYFYQSQGEPQHITAGEDGYYFLNANYIYYADKKTMKPVLLDNNPNSDCLRGSKPSDCNAYVDIQPAYPGFLSYYKGKLYTIQNQAGYEKTLTGAELIEISKDGAKRRSLLKLNSAPLAIAIHRGKVYYTLSEYDKKSNSNYQIMEMNLTGSRNKPRTVYKGNMPQGNIMDLLPYGKNLYFLEFYKDHYRTMRYDLESHSLSRMFGDDDSRNPWIVGISGQKMMLQLFNGNIEDQSNWGAYMSDLMGSIPQPLPIQRNFLSVFHWDGKYTFAYPAWGYLDQYAQYKEKYKDVKKEMTVYDKNGDPIQTVDITPLPVDYHLSPGDEHYMFIQYKPSGRQIVAIIDKSKLSSKDASMQTLIETNLP